MKRCGLEITDKKDDFFFETASMSGVKDGVTVRHFRENVVKTTFDPKLDAEEVLPRKNEKKVRRRKSHIRKN
jgi:hypothetical protein